MNKIFGFIIMAAIILIGGFVVYKIRPALTPAANQPGASDNQANVIIIKDFAFIPAELKVKAGETVTWVNQDSAPHQINSAAFNSEVLSRGQSYAFTFVQAGSFRYICSIHPDMKGGIIVE